MHRPHLGLGWDSAQLEWRLAALAVLPFANLGAGLAALWAVMLIVVAAFQADDTGELVWPALHLVAAVPFVWCARRFARSARRFVADAAELDGVVGHFAAFYVLGTLWSGIAVPVYGLVLPLAYAPMYLVGIGVLLLLVRLVRAMKARRASAR